MSQETVSPRRRSNAYNIFILVLTVISLVVMVVMLLPLHDPTLELLQFYDNLICAAFLVDFFITLRAAPKKSTFFFKEGGWLDLIGSLPYLGLTFKYSGILRLARLSRFARIRRLMRGKGKKELVEDVVNNRSQYASFITVIVALIVLMIASVLVLQFELNAPGAKITTGRDALWYSLVTITTVGYGDYYPVTPGGRATAMFIMITGVGIIGALASILASILVGSTAAPDEAEAPGPAQAVTVEQEIAEVKNELAAVRQLLEKMSIEREQE